MFHPFINVQNTRKQRRFSFHHLNIIVIGAGGNAGPLIQKLSRTIYANNAKEDSFFREITLTVVDGDKVEEKNILRQPFIKEDIDSNKAEILADRYSYAYEIPIFFKSTYISSSKDLSDLFESIPLKDTAPFRETINVLVGCVDNNKTRQYMHEFFMSQKNIIYIDAGVEGVESYGEESTWEEGFSGQVALGFRTEGEIILEPVGFLYPDILEDKTSRDPLEACGTAVLSNPQRMQTNETAALVLHSFLNNLIFDQVIVKHMVNFNAQTMRVQPTYISSEQVEKYNLLTEL